MWIGIAAGIYGFDGLMGIVFYFLMDLLVGLVISAHLGFKASPYFLNFRQIILMGLMGNFMTFMVIWVLFYNLVFIL